MLGISLSRGSMQLVLVLATVLVFIELTESCQRRVEYHYKFKKPPPPHHHHHHKGHSPHGHGHPPHRRPPKNHEHHVQGGHQAHAGGHNHHGGSYQNIHKGFNREHQPVKGYGHISPTLYLGGDGYSPPGKLHGSQGHKGYREEHRPSSPYGPTSVNGGAFEAVPPSSHGFGSFPSLHGQSSPSPPGHSYGPYSSPEPTHGTHGGHYSSSPPGYGHDFGRGGHSSSGGEYSLKGQKGNEKGFEYQTFESYKGNQPSNKQKTNSNLDYDDSVPVYMQKGYGNSGPYHDVEYSAPIIVTTVQNPSFDQGPHRHSLNSFNVFDGPPDGTGWSLDAADTADLIRLGQNNNKFAPSNPMPPPSYIHSAMNFEDASKLAKLYEGAELILTSSANENIASSMAKYYPVSATVEMTNPEMEHDEEAAELAAAELPSMNTQIDTTINNDGNFDMNLNYNSEPPESFRRLKKRRRRRKGQNRKIRPNPKKPQSVVISHHRQFTDSNGEPETSQSQRDDFVNLNVDRMPIAPTTRKTPDYTEFMISKFHMIS